jgi:alkylation response protein AidB-like acyl-CoA dehydrogenase
VLTLEYSAEQQALGDTIVAFGTATPADQFLAPERWRALADIGVLALGAEGCGGPLDVAAAMEALGRIGHPGPFVPALFGNQILAEPVRTRVGAGEAMVGLVIDGILTEPRADVLIEADGVTAWIVETIEPPEPMTSLAGRPWARAATRRLDRLDNAASAYRIADLAVAAWVIGAARHLLTLGATHARHRRQFGRPIADFQAVSHPLAAAAAEVGAAGDFLRLAARAVPPDRPELLAAQVRAVATRAALQASFAVHQAYGAVGFAAESEIARFSTGIRECSLVPPLASRHRDSVSRGIHR